MSTTTLHPAPTDAHGALLPAIRVSTAALVILAGGLGAQLWRHDALAGGRVARMSIPHGDPGWRWPHFVANGVSVAGGTLTAPTLLLVLAAALSVRARRWSPLLGAGAAVLAVGACVGLGKGLAGGSAVSGPATTSVVCWAAAGWLVHRELSTRLLHALHWLAGSAALAVGVSQLYLGHPLPALLVSWLLGALVVGLLALGRAPGRRPG